MFIVNNKKFISALFVIFILFNLGMSGHGLADDKDDAKKKKKKKESVKPKKKVINASLISLSQKISDLDADENFKLKPSVVSQRWLPILTSIREGALPRQDAIDSINRFTNDIWDILEKKVNAGQIRKYSDAEWVFPVKGYSASAIGGNNGSGYISAGFDFFDKNSGGHPAHDIFIADGNQDCLDDRTGEPVEILSMTGGIVVETRKIWTPEMTDIKGGNIVYVYDNYTNGLFYYAHLKEVFVDVGDLVKPGMPLGNMGRTGKNAYPSRSPTHLHIMYVRSFDGDLRPEDIYGDLVRVKTIP